MKRHMKIKYSVILSQLLGGEVPNQGAGQASHMMPSIGARQYLPGSRLFYSDEGNHFSARRR